MPAGSYLASDFNQWDLAVTPQNPSVLDYGEQKIAEQILAREQAHSRQLVEVTSAVGFWTTESTLPFGGYDRGQGYEVGELGRAKPSKGGVGYYCGLPLREWQYSWQGSYRFFRQASAALVSRNASRMLEADASYVMARILDALFNPVNYNHVDDITRDGVRLPTVPLAVKGLANADGLELPAGPHGQRFNAGTHTHYAAEVGFTAAAVAATIATVREHERNSRPEVWINTLQATAISAMTPNFQALFYANVTPAENAARVLSPAIDPGNPGDRLIGYFDNCPVYEKPQMPNNYVLVVETNTDMKPVGIRYSEVLGGRSLSPYAEDEVRPLRAQTFNRYIGCGVWNRVGAAVLQVNKGDTTYVAPTFPDLAA